MAETVTVLVGRCTMQINCEPFFDNSTLANIRKLFRYIFQEPDRNTETIAALGRYLPTKVAETKAAWDDASIARTNGWGLKCHEKRAKAKHEKYQKILTAFEAVKNKNT